MRVRYFYLEDGENKVDLMDVGRIASLAVALKPLSGDTKVMGHYNALDVYMNNNKDNFLFNAYTLLKSDDNCKKLLYSNIGICLLEKSFREEGASKDSIKEYVTYVNRYHSFLNDNFEKYAHNSKLR